LEPPEGVIEATIDPEAAVFAGVRAGTVTGTGVMTDDGGSGVGAVETARVLPAVAVTTVVGEIEPSANKGAVAATLYVPAFSTGLALVSVMVEPLLE
jgi:hypothetical protein